MFFIENLWDEPESIEYSLDVFTKDDQIQTMGTYLAEVTPMEGNEIKFFSRVNYSKTGDYEESEVVTDNIRFIPKRSKVIQHCEKGDIILNADYKSNSIYLTADTYSGNHKKKINVSETVFDSIEIIHIISKIDFEKQQSYSFKMLSLQIGRVFETEIKYLGTEDYVISDKKIGCFRVSLELIGLDVSRQFILYSNNNRRSMVKYVMKNNIIHMKDSEIDRIKSS